MSTHTQKRGGLDEGCSAQIRTGAGIGHRISYQPREVLQ
jgi:hypothetical protein